MVRALGCVLGAILILFAGAMLVNDCDSSYIYRSNDPVEHNRAVLKENFGVPPKRIWHTEEGGEGTHTGIDQMNSVVNGGHNDADIRRIRVKSL